MIRLYGVEWLPGKGRPRALVLGPTRELTDQILRVAKALAHTAKFRRWVGCSLVGQCW